MCDVGKIPSGTQKEEDTLMSHVSRDNAVRPCGIPKLAEYRDIRIASIARLRAG
jgi:hypothetical protein